MSSDVIVEPVLFTNRTALKMFAGVPEATEPNARSVAAAAPQL
jgi:hypothetical protein